MLIAAGGFFAGYFTYSGSLDEQIRTLLWAKGLIQENYYEEIDDDEFYDAVFDGVNSLLDPYSQYFSSEEYEAWMADSEGITLGAGITFSSEEINQNNRMLVEWVSGNSPAERAGIRTGMYVVGYGPNANEVVERGDYESVMSFLLGQPEGQPFVLAVSDTPDGEYEAVTLTREVFVANNVFYRSADSAYIFTGEKATTLTESDNVLSALDEDTAYIRLVLFTGGASEQFAKAMDVFRREGKKNLILDLRADGGGYLNIMCDIASYFCKDARSETPLVSTAEYRSGKKMRFMLREISMTSIFRGQPDLCHGGQRHGVRFRMSDRRHGGLRGCRLFGHFSLHAERRSENLWQRGNADDLSAHYGRRRHQADDGAHLLAVERKLHTRPGRSARGWRSGRDGKL